ncbi:MAG: hypothetical protein A2W80_06010 [Candidatus Riflebacteria bacterium GWC2_50_8]|nr:MAG: hypothetical protein A2W80_06010 [Candidatus Riflebacteria bacterium GWC2_50_8]
MFRNSYLWFLLLSLVFTAVSRHFYVESYRREMKTVFSEQELELVHQRAGAFFEPDPELASQTTDVHQHEQHVSHDHECGEECGHQHETMPAHEVSQEHDHHHCISVKLGDDEIVLKAASGTHDEGEEHAHHDHHAGHGHGSPDSSISPGFVLLLRQLGFAELAANLLWIQMDADSHSGLWHRVEFALELIPALDPTFIDAYLLRAYMLDMHMKLHDKALQVLESAVKQVPNRIELWQQIGIHCLNFNERHGKTRRLPRALEVFQRMCSFQDPPPHAIRMVAITLAAMEQREEAVRILEAAAASPERTEEQRRTDQLIIERVKSGEKF